MMVLAIVLEVDPPDMKEWPPVRTYLDLLRERPSYEAISPKTKVADAPRS
jgi:hypothetical protein